MKYSISILILCTLLSACSQSVPQEEYDSMLEEKDYRIAELESKVAALEDHIQSLESKTDDVNEQFERLQTENWRDVVPDAENSLDELNSEIANNPEY